MFGLKTAIRFHEVGIISNRKSACYGEYVLEPCTHRPSHAGSESRFKLSRFIIFLKNFTIYFTNIIEIKKFYRIIYYGVCN